VPEKMRKYSAQATKLKVFMNSKFVDNRNNRQAMSDI